MEEAGNSLNSRDELEPNKSEAGLEMAQSILSKFSMKSLFGFTSKLDSLDPEEEDAVLKAFRSLEVDPAPERDDPSEGSDQSQAEAPVPPDLENDGNSARAETGSEGSQEKVRSSTSSPGHELRSPASVSVDSEDVLWVRGTLVHTTSDSDSEDGGQEAEEGSGLDTQEPTTVVSSKPSQEPKERLEDSGEHDHTGETDDAELRGDSQKTLPETSSKVDPGGDDSHRQGQVAEERSQTPPAATDQTVAVAEGTICKRERDTPGEKSFQLPAFFSGLRVLKKGATAEAGETITEIKPKDGDLALLKLTQPVHKSLVQGGPQTVKSQGRATDPKATPTLLEQLSQLLNIDMPRTEVKEADPELRGADEMGYNTEQESQKSSGDAQVQDGQVKSKPPETALEAFKALFIRPPKKGTTADTSELEALKRKMRNEKESLRAVFERSKSRPADSPTDPKSVCRIGFCILT